MDIAAYTWTIFALVGIAVLTVVQLLIADLARLRNKVRPGMPIEADPEKFVFRAHRAHRNSVENLGPFVLLALLALAVQAPARWTNAAAVLFVSARVLHMGFYYLDQRRLRPAAFAMGVIATLVMAGTIVRQIL